MKLSAELRRLTQALAWFAQLLAGAALFLVLAWAMLSAVFLLG